jgi:DNA modification methylase
LANGPIREEIEKEGGLKLIYIDPPFAVGADFGFNIEIGGETAEKKQSIIEEIAYRDTWGKGISSYLSMMYERLKIMYNLLSDDGSLFLHCDQRTNAPLRFIVQDVFGYEFFKNEIVWQRTSAGKTVSGNLPKNCDYLLWSTKSDNFKFKGFYGELTEQNIKVFNKDDKDGRGLYRTQPVIKTSNPGPQTTYDYVDNQGRVWKCPRKGWRFNKERMKALENDNRLIFTSVISEKYYLKERMEIGRQLSNLWSDISGNTVAFSGESVDYPTQKPEKLLERIINSLTDEKDLVADFFCGSGTTAAVAEKLNRKWIAADLGRFAIHTTRKRMIGIQRELQENGKDFRAFEILNLGKYERKFFMDDLTNGARKSKEDLYVNLILEAYKAKRIEGHKTLHGSKAGRFVNVGPLDVPVTQTRLLDIFEECKQKLYTQVDVLGFEFEMGLTPQFIQELKEKGVAITLKYIPKDVFDKRAVEKGQARFYDVAYLNADIHQKGKTVQIELTDFVTHYTQDDIEDIQQSMRAGSKVVIEDGQIIKITKDKNGIITRDILTENWFDWIDYWAIDFNYEDKKEIIKITNDKGEVEEKWTGNYLFENEWQSFRTKKNQTLEFTSTSYEYKKSGKYKVMVKVVDILGIDTSKIIELNI